MLSCMKALSNKKRYLTNPRLYLYGQNIININNLEIV